MMEDQWIKSVTCRVFCVLIHNHDCLQFRFLHWGSAVQYSSQLKNMNVQIYIYHGSWGTQSIWWPQGFRTCATNSFIIWRVGSNKAFSHVLLVLQCSLRSNHLVNLLLLSHTVDTIWHWLWAYRLVHQQWCKDHALITILFWGQQKNKLFTLGEMVNHFICQVLIFDLHPKLVKKMMQTTYSR